MGQTVSSLWKNRQEHEKPIEKPQKKMLEVHPELVRLLRCVEAATGELSSSVPTSSSIAEQQHKSEMSSFYGTEASSSKATPVRDVDDERSVLTLHQQELPIERLAMLDCDTLRVSVDPLYRSMQSIDAESLLSLHRVDPFGAGGDGAALHCGVKVRPIHDMIQPPKPPGVLRYLYISEVDQKYSIGIFVFPPYAKIPLHDHPNMCVLSRILYGSVERTSLDLMRPEKPSSRRWGSGLFQQYIFGFNNNKNNHDNSQDGTKGARRVARLCETETLVAPAVTVLYPHEGNLHEFTAGPHGAAVLDVLLPPYDVQEDRHCNFYRILMDGPGGDQDGLVLVEEIEQPKDFHCLSGNHMGVGE